MEFDISPYPPTPLLEGIGKERGCITFVTTYVIWYFVRGPNLPIFIMYLCRHFQQCFWPYTKSSTTWWSEEEGKGRKGGGLELDDLSKGDGQKHTWTNTFINLLQYGLLTKWLSLKWYYNLHVLVLLTLQINWGFCFYSKVVPSPYLSFNFEWWKSTNAVLLIPCQNSNLKWPNVWQLL